MRTPERSSCLSDYGTSSDFTAFKLDEISMLIIMTMAGGAEVNFVSGKSDTF